MMFSTCIWGITIINMAGMMAKYLAMSLAMEKVVRLPRVMSSCLPISTTSRICLLYTSCLFETASAIGTVGLSLGITPQLSWISHLILIALMFFGRVGGLTLIFAALSNALGNSARLPQERITVG